MCEKKRQRYYFQGEGHSWTTTTMSSPRLPPEIPLDRVVDFLHDNLDALESCCLVSKSWLPRARKHLFANIRFDSKQHLQSWKSKFSDPATSPVRYAEGLLVGCPQVITAADAEEGGWIQTFSQVVLLVISPSVKYIGNPEISPVPFHGFSPVLGCGIGFVSCTSVLMPNRVFLLPHTHSTLPAEIWTLNQCGLLL